MKVYFQIAECRFFLFKDNANERNESTFRLPSAAFSSAKIMQIEDNTKEKLHFFFFIVVMPSVYVKYVQFMDNTKKRKNKFGYYL